MNVFGSGRFVVSLDLLVVDNACAHRSCFYWICHFLSYLKSLELQLPQGRHVTEGLREFRFDAAETTSITSGNCCPKLANI